MFQRASLALYGVALSLVGANAFAAAETYATDAATYISGDGKLTLMAILGGTATLAVIVWVARKVGMR